MKNQSYFQEYTATTTPVYHPISLYQLVQQLQTGLIPEAVERRSIIINNVDKALFLRGDENAIAYIIGGFISNAIYSTSECCIHIEAVTYSDEIQIRVRNNGCFSYSSRMISLAQMSSAARSLGGSIGLYNDDEKGLSVVLSVQNSHAA